MRCIGHAAAMAGVWRPVAPFGMVQLSPDTDQLPSVMGDRPNRNRRAG
ncbi:hypothetical protein [Brevundimonas sp.]|nr:hypothetical protein [Brevundimonas sp.]